MDINWAVLGIMGSIGTSVALLTWWLSGQFSNLRHLMYDRIDRVHDSLMTKLEYHEKHDDQRFAEIRNDLWTIRVRNAAKDEMLKRLGFSDYMNNEAKIRRRLTENGSKDLNDQKDSTT